MRSYFSRFLLLAFLIILCSSKSLGASISIQGIGITLPPSVNWYWILKDGSLNGVPTQIVGLRFRQPMSQVVEHFGFELSRHGEFLDHNTNGWRVLSQSTGKRFLSLQLTEQGSAVIGTLTVSDDYANKNHSRMKLFKLPPGYRILNLVQDKTSETATLSSGQSVSNVSQWMQSELSRQGWEKNHVTQSLQFNGKNLFFTRGSHTARVFIANDATWGNQTLVYINSYSP